MQYFKESDSTLIAPPTNFKTPGGSWIMNFNKSPAAMVTYGFKPFTDEQLQQWHQQHPQPQPPVPQEPDTTAFDAACQQFRTICAQIGAAIDQPDFKGGFDEMALFAQSPVYSTIEGLKLAMSWSASNQLCKYEGQKLGLGQPDWWYHCWQNKE